MSTTVSFGCCSSSKITRQCFLSQLVFLFTCWFLLFKFSDWTSVCLIQVSFQEVSLQMCSCCPLILAQLVSIYKVVLTIGHSLIQNQQPCSLCTSLRPDLRWRSQGFVQPSLVWMAVRHFLASGKKKEAGKPERRQNRSEANSVKFSMSRAAAPAGRRPTGTRQLTLHSS